MIVEFFIGLWDTIATAVLGLMPKDPAPDFLVNADGVLNTLLQSIQGMGAWVDIPFAITVVTAVLGAWLVGATVKIVRWLIGLIPTMGGGS